LNSDRDYYRENENGNRNLKISSIHYSSIRNSQSIWIKHIPYGSSKLEEHHLALFSELVCFKGRIRSINRNRKEHDKKHPNTKQARRKN